MRNKTWIVIGLILGSLALGQAQGLIPPRPATGTTVSTAPVNTLLIGQRLAEEWTIVDNLGRNRPLLSMKAALEVFVIYATSGSCDAERSVFPRYKRLYERFKDWRVSFIELRNSHPAAEGLWPFPKVTDTTGRLYSALGIEGTPMVLIIDEGGVLRYRGTIEDGPMHLTSAGRALDAVIGHVHPVSDPEPQPTLLCPVP